MLYLKFKQSRSYENVFVYHIGVYHAARDHEYMERHMAPRVLSADGAEYRAEEINRAPEHEKQERMNIYLVYNRERAGEHHRACDYIDRDARGFRLLEKKSFATSPNITLPQPSRSTAAQQILL